MTEKRWPIKICVTWEHFCGSAPARSFSASDQVYPDYPVFIRSDLAERMAEALSDTATLLKSFSTPDDEIAKYILDMADSALSAFRSATQDTEARHD